MLVLVKDGEATIVRVKIVPGASKTRCLGEWDGRARIAVAAPPEKGKANKALIAFLAGAVGVQKRDVAIVAGLTSRLKNVRIARAGEREIRAALETPRR